MSTSKPRTNNAIKAQARAYQTAHPGTSYTAAREAVLHHASTVAASTSPFEDSLLGYLVGQPDAKVKLRQVFAMEEVQAERKRRAKAASWLDPKSPPPPHTYQVFPKVHIVGPPGSGKSTVVSAVHDEMRRVAYANADAVRQYHASLRDARAKERGGEGHFVPTTVTRGTERPVAIPTTTVSAVQFLGGSRGEGTQQLVQPVVERAEGGLLVIEDISVLVSDDDNRDALTVLANEIRLLSHALAVCLVGYDDTMQCRAAKDLMGMFPITVKLGSVTADDARTLAEKFAGETLEPRALDAIADHVRELEKRSANEVRPLIDVLGNARFIRSVVEHASGQAAARLSSRDLRTVTDEELNTLTVEDVTAALRVCTRV